MPRNDGVSNLETPELVIELQSCTHSQFPALRDRAMARNNEALALARSNTSSAFEKRQLKEHIHKILRAIEDADRRLFSAEFRFSGDPIPASTGVQTGIATDGDTSQPNVGVKSRLCISDQTDTLIDLGDDCSGKHVHMQNLSGTTISGSGTPASISFAGATSIAVNVCSSGPVMVQNASHSVFVVRCHQLRMHGCTNCVIFATIPSNRVIIERCRQLQIGSRSNPKLSEEILVDDFDWPSNAPNPHYRAVELSGTDFSQYRSSAEFEESRSMLRHFKSEQPE